MSAAGDRRNPYLVLGVDHGADREVVTAAYTRRARLARADNSSPYSIDDLVWALDEIEGLHAAGGAASGSGAQAATFRVPADPAVYQPPAGPGLLRPVALPLRRRSRHAPRAEVAGLVADARRDATADALVQLAEQVERTLVAPAGRVRLHVTEPPRQPRSRGPLLALCSVVALAAVAAVLFLVGRGDEEQPPAESTAAPTTTEFVVVTAPPAQGFQTPVEADGVQITPTQPVSAFGTTCVIWELAGAAPLSFDPAAAQLIAGGATFVDVPATRSGRVAAGTIDPAATTASAETCFAVGDAAPSSSEVELRYTPPGIEGSTPYRWIVTMP